MGWFFYCRDSLSFQFLATKVIVNNPIFTPNFFFTMCGTDFIAFMFKRFCCIYVRKISLHLCRKDFVATFSEWVLCILSKKFSCNFVRNFSSIYFGKICCISVGKMLLQLCLKNFFAPLSEIFCCIFVRNNLRICCIFAMKIDLYFVTFLSQRFRCIFVGKVRHIFVRKTSSSSPCTIHHAI